MERVDYGKKGGDGAAVEGDCEGGLEGDMYFMKNVISHETWLNKHIRSCLSVYWQNPGKCSTSHG